MFDKTMIETIREFGLTVIEDIQDLGYFGWRPQGPYKQIHQVTAEELRNGTKFKTKPHMVQPIEDLEKKCPKTFKSEKVKQPRNEYPYNPSYLVPLYVAVVDRGVNVDSIDFLFGGSVLHMLSTSKIKNDVQYWAQRIPGTRIVAVEKKQHYSTNWTDFGHEFERFVLGQSNTQETIMHLQIMKLGGCRVLFAAETDGMDQEERPVEIKSSNPRNWGIQVPLQMISNGSHSLYTAVKSQNTLKKVEQLSLSSVLQKVFDKQSIRKETNSNIRNGIQALMQTSIDFETPHTLHFEGEKNKHLIFQPVSSFPSMEETIKLLKVPPTNKPTGFVQNVDAAMSQMATMSIEPDIRDRVDWDSYYEYMESLPDEVAIGMGYIPDDFIGFNSD